MNMQTTSLLLISFFILQAYANDCQLSVNQVRRTIAGSSWVSNTYTYQIYDTVFTNTGNKTIVGAEFSMGLPSGYPTQWWGLTKICCTQVMSAITFNVTIPYPLAPGATANAGFILQYSMQVRLTDPSFVNPIVPTEFHAWVTCLA